METYRFKGAWLAVQTLGWRLLEEGHKPFVIYYGLKAGGALFVCEQEGGRLFLGADEKQRQLTARKRASRLGLEYALLDDDPSRASFLTPLTTHHLSEVQEADGVQVPLLPARTLGQRSRSGMGVGRSQQVPIGPQNGDQQLSVVLDHTDRAFAHLLADHARFVACYALAQATATYCYLTASQRQRLRARGYYVRIAAGLPYEQRIALDAPVEVGDQPGASTHAGITQLAMKSAKALADLRAQLLCAQIPQLGGTDQ